MRTALLGAATVAALAAGTLATTGVLGSSHREAPRIMLDPSADNTDLYAFTAPDAPGKVTIVSNWVPLQNPAGGPYFGKLDPRRALLRQDRQHRRRRRGRRLPLAVQQQVPEPELVPVRGPAGQLDRRREPQLRPDLRPLLRALPQRQARQLAADRQERAGRARQRRPEDDAQLRGGRGAGERQPARRRARPSSARPMTRSSSTSARSSTASTSTSPAARRSGSATRAAARTTSRASTSTRSSCRCRSPTSRATAATSRARRPRTPSSASGRRPSARRSRSTAASARGALGAGQPPRQPADQRGHHPDRRQGQVQRDVPRDDLKNFGAGALSPEPARILNALFNLGIKENNRTDIVQALLTGIPGLTQIAPNAVPGRHAEVQPRRAAGGDPEPLRRARR